MPLNILEQYMHKWIAAQIAETQNLTNADISLEKRQKNALPERVRHLNKVAYLQETSCLMEWETAIVVVGP